MSAALEDYDRDWLVPGLGSIAARDFVTVLDINPAFAEAFERIRGLLLMLLPRYARQGKPYVHIAFGCTGGRHRSVFTTERMAQALRTAGFSPTVRHRNLGSRAADTIERDRR